MNKKIKKALLKFVLRNAKQIKSKSIDKQWEMLGSSNTCLFRLYRLPNYIRNDMTDKEFLDYKSANYDVTTPSDMKSGLEWIRRFCK